MSLFAEHAEQLMDAAQSALMANGFVSDTAIVVGRDGAIRVVDASSCRLDSLEAAYGAAAAYRISNGRDGLQVEGRAEGRSCLLRSTPPAAAARLLLGRATSGTYSVSTPLLA